MLVYKRTTIYLAHELSRKEKAAIFLTCARWYARKSRVNLCAVRMCNAKQRNDPKSSLHLTIEAQLLKFTITARRTSFTTIRVCDDGKYGKVMRNKFVYIGQIKFKFNIEILNIASPSDHPCSLSYGGCSHLCLLRPDGYRCSCPRNLTLSEDGKTCVHSQSSEGKSD